jgi:membrane associated rhomboid family serine protease
MKTVIRNFCSSIPRGAGFLVLLYVLGYPLALAGEYTRHFELYVWLALDPMDFWRGEIWRAVTYAFLPNGFVDWAVSLFWLATLVSVLARNWSGGELWVYTLVCTAAGALVVCAGAPHLRFAVAGNGAMIFGFLAAWHRLYGRERLILLGVGEISASQAAGLVAIIEMLVLFFSFGWLITLAMVSGGAAGWLYLVVRGRTALNRRSRQLNSERIARLEI